MYNNNYGYPYQNNRMNYLEQQQRYQMQQQQYNNMLLKGRVVGSYEEVAASAIDLDGSMHYFPDTMNKRIYVKYLDVDGRSKVDIYEKINPVADAAMNTPQQAQLNNNDYVTRDEYNKLLINLNTLNTILLGGIKNGESNANATNDDGGTGQPTADDGAISVTESDVRASTANGKRKK